MKHYPYIEMDSGGNHDFPRLARESGFYFNLYRGRIDWKQIESLDIDRLIRERELETLQSISSSITSCNLTNEYDVKVLDPNFVKLFRLSQLSIDYLQYCRNYLDHCVIVLQEQLQVALHEVEQLQKERQSKEDQLKQFTKKLKEKAKLSGNNGITANVTECGHSAVPVPGINPGINSGFLQPSFPCIPCGKMFVSAIFLQRHIMRRHPEQIKPNGEADSLRLEVHQLQERLKKAEELLKQSGNQADTKTENGASKEEVETVDKEPKREKMDRSQNTDGDLLQFKSSQDDNTQKRSQKSDEDIRLLLENFKRQSEEIESLRSQLKSQHFAQESLWQNRLDQLEQRHHSDIDALRTSLSQSNSLTMHSTSKTLKELYEKQNEKQGQISRPEMVVKGTQVENVPERILPQPIQEAFTKSVPDQLFSTSPKPSPHSFRVSDSMKKEIPNPLQNQWSPEKRPENMQPAIQQPLIARHDGPSTFGSQQYSKMSGDISSTESSTEETGESLIEGTLPQKNKSETEESSTTTEDGFKKLSSLATKPQVLAPLRNDIENVMGRLLRELGIDPEWKGIPKATYQSVKANLEHQRGISQKDRRDLAKLRENLSREVDNQAQKILSSGSSPKKNPSVRKVPARPPPPRSSPSSKQGNDYTVEPGRGRPVKPIVVYEEVKKIDDERAEKNDEPDVPIPPIRRRIVEKQPIPLTEPSAPVPPPRVTPTTAELLADMEKLRQQGTLLKSEASSMAKSNLKSSSSTGSIAKKRVVFLDEKDDFPTVDLGLNDTEFGMFQTRNPADANLTYSSKNHVFTASNISRDTTTNYDNFSANGSGEAVRSGGESNVARIAREIEKQLMNKPKPPSSQFSSSFGHRNNQLDLILDDLSSS